MGRLYDIIQDYIDRQAYPPSVRRLAVELGVSPTTIGNWRNIKELPKPEHLEAVARLTGTPIKDVFYAAGVDAGYIMETKSDIEAGLESGRLAARRRKPPA